MSTTITRNRLKVFVKAKNLTFKNIERWQKFNLNSSGFNFRVLSEKV